MKSRLAPLLAAVLLAAPALAAPAAAGEFEFPSTGVRVEGRALLLAIDDHLLPLRENIVPHLSRPAVRREPVLLPSKDDPAAPDQVAAHFYGSVVRDRDRFRMWYYAIGMREPGDARRADIQQLTIGPVCYAESPDGIRWTKPVLDQVEFRGSRRNNAVALPGTQVSGVHVMLDEAERDPARRLKMVYNGHNGKTWVIRTATSADGIRWQAAPDWAIDQFIETASLLRFNGLYITHGQRITFSEGGHPAGRQGRAVIAPSFDRWLPGEVDAFLLPEPADPAARGLTRPYDQVHLGVGATSLGNVCVGLYGLWHNVPGDESDQKRWGWFGYGKISCDLGLVISNNGLHFREPVKGHAFLSRHDAPATPVPGREFPTILAQSGNGILNVGDETRIYFSRWLNAAYGEGYHGEVALATLPRDRWGALRLYPAGIRGQPRPATGSVWSAPVRLPPGGARILLNADGAAGLSVELADERFDLLPEFSGERSGRTRAGEGLDCAVTWPAGSLAPLGGRTVRIKVNLHRAGDIEPALFAVTLLSP